MTIKMVVIKVKVILILQVMIMVKVTNTKTEDDAKNDGKGDDNEKVMMIVETCRNVMVVEMCYLEGLPYIALVALIEERGSSQVVLDLQLADGVHAPGHGGPVAAGHRLVVREVVYTRRTTKVVQNYDVNVKKESSTSYIYFVIVDQ